MQNYYPQKTLIAKNVFFKEHLFAIDLTVKLSRVFSASVIFMQIR